MATPRWTAVLVALALPSGCTRVNPGFLSGPMDAGPMDAGLEAGPAADAVTSPEAATFPDAASDLPPGTAPALIVGSASPLSWHGGTGGILYPNELCPAGQVVIGHLGAISPEKPYVGRVQLVCGSLRVTRTAPPYLVEVTPGATLMARGHAGGDPWTALCPSNEVVVGYSGQVDAYIESLRTHCAPLEVTADRNGIRIGAIRDLPAYGTGTAPAFQDHCHLQGQVLVGADIRTGGWLDAIRPQCAPITVRP